MIVNDTSTPSLSIMTKQVKMLSASFMIYRLYTSVYYWQWQSIPRSTKLRDVILTIPGISELVWIEVQLQD